MSSTNDSVSVVVSCIDYRFWPGILPILQEKCGLFDLVATAGGAKSFVSPTKPENQISLLENIETSIKLHNAKKLILTNHFDCGAYGGSENFHSREEEISFQEKELRQAKIFAQEEFPKLKIESFIIGKDQWGKISLTEVL